ncbi:IS3 family transposase [Microbulbifer sp. GL-2]|uniref:IS3 family transposase n=1 Tax=Microbulbifer sp. GL-2 TaxID=2591606 RepID=UPI00351A6C9C
MFNDPQGKLSGNLYSTREEAISDLRAYITYYNSYMLQTTLGYVTPIKFEKCA